MAKIPVVDKNACIGCGLCLAIAPHTFKLDDNNKAAVTNPAGDELEKIQEAIDSCPVAAITLSEEE